ncbi:MULTISPECIES: hypothetical protein [Bacillus cereus group]|uniref:Uncharacterized protein n=3 Tax=Bacillus cereus group TaxID=86661 RepID=A0A9W5RC07_BACCE|nr:MULTISPECIES: hypothetical protein [Bacillus cereus group]AJI08960.1 hypothetical protein AK40_5566 [Bacillus cereus 03BB108]EDX59804.1 hypothetical protein BC03BB108_B0212 [Bacillus cereus 03BB108]EOQ19785.1 hypothetical protein IKC_04259 [Bacillus cereus VD184]OUB76883.1 hypothetical protein BK750_03145 [Bacillus thuringiensis serovar jegathesan]QKG99055.1 hypothetical protein FOC96_02040 [Bacillus cereus]
MSNISGLGLGLLIVMLLVFFQIDLASVNTIHQENRESVDIASVDAISLAVNRGDLRVKERMTIDEDVAKASFAKSFSKNTSFNIPNSKRRLEIHNGEFGNSTPLLSVGVRSLQGSYTKNYFQNWGEYKDDNYIRTSDKQITIIEAKDLRTPPVGGVYND